MTEKQLTKYKGKIVEFDYLPFKNAIACYHIIAYLYDYIETVVNTLRNNVLISKVHYDFMFELLSIETKQLNKHCSLKLPEVDTTKLFDITYDKIKLMMNFKEVTFDAGF